MKSNGVSDGLELQSCTSTDFGLRPDLQFTGICFSFLF